MNEEDIIDILENVFIFKNTNDNFTRLDLDAINGLLDLYKQEKEKNKKLEEVIDMMAEDLDNGIDFNNCVLDKGFTICNKEVDCVKCVKEYYFNKAKGNK